MADVTAAAGRRPRAAGSDAARRLRAMPLRWRLLAVTLGLIAVALAMTSLVVSALLRVYLLNQTEQELRVYAASLASIDAAELSEAGPQLPTGFTPAIIDLDTGRSTSLGEAVTEPDQAEIPVLPPPTPGSRRRDPSRSARPAATGEWLALAQLNETGNESTSWPLPLQPPRRAPSTSSSCMPPASAPSPCSSAAASAGTSSAAPSGP